MAKKNRPKGPDAEVAAEEKAAKAAVSDVPLRHKGLAALKAQRDALEAEAREKERAKKEAERLERERREALGLKAKRPHAATHAKGAPGASGAAVSTGKGYDVWRPDLEKELFSVAMSGVVPLAPKEGAPRVKPAPGAIPPTPPGKSAAKHRRAAAEGDQKFAVRWGEHGVVIGAREGKRFALEALGRFAQAEDTLDLHGLDAAAARVRVAEFVRTRRARALRVVSIVHGVGKHSADGASVLCEAAVAALSEPPGCLEVDAFKSADPTMNPSAGRLASGALWVALRAK